MTAYYNDPIDDRDLVASFHSRGEADDYAERYGGEVDAAGVVFTVGRGADHARARKEARDAAEGNAPAPAPAPDGGDGGDGDGDTPNDQ